MEEQGAQRGQALDEHGPAKAVSVSAAASGQQRMRRRQRPGSDPAGHDDLELDAGTEAQLQRYGFDRSQFEALRRQMHAEDAGRHDNSLHGLVECPGHDDLNQLPAAGSAAHSQLAAQGRRALAAGQVGVVILAGGMATRFGGGVKAAVEVLPGQSFLDLKLADVSRVCRDTGGRVPVYLLVSFATDPVVSALALAHHARGAQMPIEPLAQSVSLRLDAAGGVFRERNGKASPYATGHGDLTFALRASGALQRFRAAGGRCLLVSNVDNLAATLDPAVIGAHLAGGRPVTVEVVQAQPGDVGGAPARVDGVLQIVEAFRFPRAFDQSSLPAFNTNTFVLDAAAIDRDFDLSFFRVQKQAEGRQVVQFERLLGQVTAFLPTSLLVVPRHGPESRFAPIKEPGDLERSRAHIRRTLELRGVVASVAAPSAG